MKSIFWIGCILAVLVSLLASGAIATSMDNSTVPASPAVDVNMTAETEPVMASENITENATEVQVVETSPVAEINATVEGPANETTPAEVAPVAEPDLVNDTLVKFVTDARTFAINSGKSAAIATFNNPSGGYVNKDMYIFAYDLTGKALALPYNAGAVGMNQIALTDSSGLRYVQQMVDTAKTGVGFVKYQEANLLNKGAIMEKVSYVTNVDGTYFIGAGVYLSKEAKAAAAPVAEINATADVNATMPAEVPALPAEAGTETATNSTAVTA